MKRLVVLLAIGMVLLTALPHGAPQASESQQVPCVDPRGCPDLIVVDYLDQRFFPGQEYDQPSVHTKEFKPEDCQVQEGMIEAGTRRILRFDFTTPNFGSGDLFVGDPADHPEWFDFSGCHDHFHFHEYADYRLWRPDQYERWDSLRETNPDLLASEILAANPDLQPIVGAKRGFCVTDSLPYDTAPGKYFDCGSREPSLGLQGISVGWADEYQSDQDGQFIDITGLASGTYILETEVNAERVFEESDYINNRITFTVNI